MAARIFSVFARQTRASVTWTVVAGGDGARIFESTGAGKRMVLLQELPFPEGRLQNRQLDADKEGRLHGGIGRGPRRHAAGRHEDATERQAERFAHELGALLEKARNKNQYGDLVLVAEPKLLGKLHAALGPNTRKALKDSVDKDFEGLSADEVLERLRRAS